MPQSLTSWQVRRKYLRNRCCDAHSPGDCVIGAGPSCTTDHCTQAPDRVHTGEYIIFPCSKSNNEKNIKNKERESLLT